MLLLVRYNVCRLELTFLVYRFELRLWKGLHHVQMDLRPAVGPRLDHLRRFHRLPIDRRRELFWVGRTRRSFPLIAIYQEDPHGKRHARGGNANGGSRCRVENCSRSRNCSTPGGLREASGKPGERAGPTSGPFSFCVRRRLWPWHVPVLSACHSPPAFSVLCCGPSLR